MASKRPSVMASGLLAPKGQAPARTTPVEDFPREATVEPTVEVATLPQPSMPFTVVPVAESPEPAPAMRMAPAAIPTGKRAGIKATTVGTTVYLLPDEAARVKKLAIDQRITLHDLILSGIDKVLADAGQSRLERYSPPRPRK